MVLRVDVQNMQLDIRQRTQPRVMGTVPRQMY